MDKIDEILLLEQKQLDIVKDHEQRISSLEGPLTLKGFRLPKRWVVTILTSLMFSVANFSAKTLGTSLHDRFLNIFEEDIMDITAMIRPDFVTIALFLWILGAVLKYRTDLTNNAIPAILLGVSFVICSIWGYATSMYVGSVRMIDAIIMCGLVHGLIVTAIAAYGWDVVNGIKKSKGGKK